MLIIDGVKYRLWTPINEEKEFHPLVKEYSKEIFGQNTIYFDIKTTLKSVSGIGSIPDAYAISLSKPNEWYVIENELSSHSIYDHVVKQLTKFINGLENQNTRSQIIDILYQAITEDIVLKAKVKKIIDTEDIYHFLTKLLSLPPRIVIVIDEKKPELEEATQVLKYHTDIVEFKTYTRENAPNIRAHLFEPLHGEQPLIRKGKEGSGAEFLPHKIGEITSQPEYSLPILESLIEFGGTAKALDIMAKVHEKMKNILKEKDFQTLSSGAIRWRNQTEWERNNLKESGYIKKGSPRGIWEITDDGRKFYENKKANKKE
jgi:hypothetical protein